MYACIYTYIHSYIPIYRKRESHSVLMSATINWNTFGLLLLPASEAQAAWARVAAGKGVPKRGHAVEEAAQGPDVHLVPGMRYVCMYVCMYVYIYIGYFKGDVDLHIGIDMDIDSDMAVSVD